MGCDHLGSCPRSSANNFNPRSPNGLRPPAIRCRLHSWYFNPRSPNGLRPNVIPIVPVYPHFNPRSPNGLRPIFIIGFTVRFVFQSTQPEWAATVHSSSVPLLLMISIHAARMGCDSTNFKSLSIFSGFQSTQPEWAATSFFYLFLPVIIISIHAARMGCDCLDLIIKVTGMIFQSTQPEWAATKPPKRRRKSVGHFNPRSPNGLRLRYCFFMHRRVQFQSTQPEWAATLYERCFAYRVFISIHAARMGCDSCMLPAAA